jgi:trimethylamine:corrinoid methyltransferase-like protein
VSRLTVNVDRHRKARPMFTNRMPRYEILSADALAQLDAGWRRLVTEIGVEFMSDRALDLFRAAGQRVEDNTVFLDPEFVLEQSYRLATGERLNMTDNPAVFETLDRSRRFTLRDPT